jgi:hypothetical protein
MNRILLLTAGLVLGALLAGCSKPEAPTPEMPDVLGHIHGLGVDPADNSLYVATHTGLHRVSDSGKRTRVADRYQDTMAFTVIGPRHFLAGGHPDLREQLPPHLGLIETKDAGKSWTALALQGKADFHILEPVDGTLYAYDSVAGTLLSTTNRRTFKTIVHTPLLGLATFADSADLLGTTDQAQLVRIDPAATTIKPVDGPRLVVLDTTKSGDVVGVAPDGAVHVSTNDATSWKQAGSINGPPAALTTAGKAWYAATHDAVFRSTDRGMTWRTVLDES